MRGDKVMNMGETQSTGGAPALWELPRDGGDWRQVSE